MLDAQGKPLTVREALALINQTLDEALAEAGGRLRRRQPLALAWFEHTGFTEGRVRRGRDARPRPRSRASRVDRGGLPVTIEPRQGAICSSPEELPRPDPTTDPRLTAWETVHHLIRVLGNGGEGAAAEMVAKLGARPRPARELAIPPIHALRAQESASAEALAYNGLVQSWPEIVRLARRAASPRAAQAALIESD